MDARCAWRRPVNEPRRETLTVTPYGANNCANLHCISLSSPEPMRNNVGQERAMLPWSVCSVSSCVVVSWVSSKARSSLLQFGPALGAGYGEPGRRNGSARHCCRITAKRTNKSERDHMITVHPKVRRFWALPWYVQTRMASLPVLRRGWFVVSLPMAHTARLCLRASQSMYPLSVSTIHGLHERSTPQRISVRHISSETTTTISEQVSP